MNTESIGYVIEVHNNLNQSLRSVYIDHTGDVGEHAVGTPSLRNPQVLTPTLSEKEKKYVIDSLHNAPYREMQCGARALPEIISRFGGMVLPTRQVNFTVKIYRLTCSGSVVNIKAQFIDSFEVKGLEGKGKHNRHLTKYVINQHMQIAA